MNLRLNLLPWRERRDAAVLKRLRQRLIISGVLALAGVLFIERLVQQRATAYRQSTHALQRDERRQQGSAEAVAERGKARLALEAQAKSIEDLGARQHLLPDLLQALEDALPTGVQLTQLDVDDTQVSVKGLAASPAVLAQFMRALSHHALLDALEVRHLQGVASGEAFLVTAQLQPTT